MSDEINKLSESRGVMRPSCHDSVCIHITMQYYFDTPRHMVKGLTENVLLINMLNLILHCGCQWIHPWCR